jgi:hypothetical protein
MTGAGRRTAMASAMAGVWLLALPAIATAETGGAASADNAAAMAARAAVEASAAGEGSFEPTKKDLFLERKRERAGDGAPKGWQARLDRRVGEPPPALINLYNTWTREFLSVEVEGTPRVPGDIVNRFLRCHFTNQPATMDPKLFRALVGAAQHFNARRIDVVSGYRAPKYNLILRKKGREVARESQHTMGSAVDFRVRGVATGRLHAWARSLRMGGVGIYPNSGFIHIDTGRIRYWGGR